MPPITWEDLNVNECTRGADRPWCDRNGQRRIFVSLKGAAFVHHVFWFEKWTPDRPETKAAILLIIARELNAKLQAIKQYLPSEP